MRNRGNDLSESFLGPAEPDPESEHSVLLIVAGRMQGESLRYQLVSCGFEVDLARSVSSVLERLNGKSYDAVVLDWQTLEVEYPSSNRVEVWLRLVRDCRAQAKAVGLVALLDSEQSAPLEIEQAGAVRISRGAAGEPHSLAAAVERAMERQPAPVLDAADDKLADRSAKLAPQPAPAGVIEHFLFGESAAIRRVFEQVRLVARRDTTVLITGETGTGKERVSRAIHRMSSRHKLEMVSINCGGIPATLLEDEFFGHVKGAFTDARQARIGRFEQADASTIFLDEIGDLPLELQPKLLRVLQEREIHRIGGVDAIKLDVRVIAATNVDLWRRVADGRFREDLFYRINVFHIHLPPLRERTEDIPLFIRYFLEKLCRRDGLPPKILLPSAEAELIRRPWRGNIRELENAVEIAVIRSQDRTELTEKDFPPSREGVGQTGDWPLPVPVTSPAAAEAKLDFKALVTRYERDLILRTLELTQGNKNKAAQMLRLKRTTLIEKLKRFES
jgi:transcriptional regulator with GAF, ATPase, and Fis domain